MRRPAKDPRGYLRLVLARAAKRAGGGNYLPPQQRIANALRYTRKLKHTKRRSP